MPKRLTSLLLALLLLFPCAALCETAAKDTPATPQQHILLLGFDFWGSEEIGNSWSDTNLLLTIDVAANRILITSMARDSYLALPDGSMSRINSIVRDYDFDTYVQTMANNLELDISYYVAISGPGFARMIGAMGGLTLDITKEEYDSLVKIGFAEGIAGPGKRTLRGNAVLRYVRNRSRGGHDLTRTDTARKVMQAAIEQLREKPLDELLALVDVAQQEIRTNVPPAAQLLLVTSLAVMDGPAVENLRLPIPGAFKTETVHGAAVNQWDLPANVAALHAFLQGDEAK